LEGIDFALVVIDADDVVTYFREAGTGDETDIAGANDAEFHLVLFLSGVDRPEYEDSRRSGGGAHRWKRDRQGDGIYEWARPITRATCVENLRHESDDRR
jgi:hypothetical protein